MTMLFYLFILGVVFIGSVGEARVIRLPQDAQTLQEAINRAQDRDTILVAGGEYRGQGNINLSVNRPLTFIAPQGPMATVIDGEGNDGVFLFNVTNASFALIGFTVQRFTAGAITLSGSSPFLILNCRLVSNHSPQQGVQGSALRLLNASRGVIRHTLFMRNQTAGSGAGIYATGGTQFTAIHCLFLENRSDRFGGGVLTTGADTRGEFLNALFVGNRAGIDGGGAASSVNSVSTFAFSTFFSNRAEGDNSMGGGFYKGSNSNPEIINSLFWHNQAAVGPQLYGQDNGGVITISYCLIEGGDENLGQANVGEGIIDDDPQFVEGREPDWGIAGFFLDPESPAVDAGDDEARAWGMDTLTTQADLTPDQGTADLGFHYDPDDFTRLGFLYGWVTRSRDGDPLPEATVITSRGDRALTDEEGYWEIPQARIGELQVTASKPWYLPVTREVELEEEDTLEVNFALPQPLISFRPRQVEVSLNAGDSTEAGISISNPGDGRLDWRASARLHPDDEVPLWESRLTLPASQITGDPRLNGVAFDGEFFYIAGAADQDHNYIYLIDLESQQEVERFDQPSQSLVGFRDLEWDGEYLWGVDGPDIVRFTTRGERITAFRTNVNPLYGVAWDPVNQRIWCSGITSNLLAYDTEGNLVGQLNRRGIRQYGLGYYSDDPDGYFLYVTHNSGQEGYLQVIYKVNPLSGDTLQVVNLSPLSSGNGLGLVVYPGWDSYSDVLITLVNDGNNDRVEVRQLASFTSWMRVEPSEGAIEGGEEEELVVTLSSTRLSDGLYRGRILLEHNADPGISEIPVILEVTGGPVLTRRRLDFAMGWNLISLNILPERDEIPEIFAPLVEEGVLSIVKDDSGRFYLPARNGFNNLPPWRSLKGYWVKTFSSAQLTVSGVSIPPDSVLRLQPGWQLVSYLPRRSMEVSQGVACIRDQLIIIKNGFGNFYMPSRNFSNMPPLSPGRGYAVKMAEGAELIWGQAPPQGLAHLPEVLTVARAPRHYLSPPPTGADMSLLIVANDKVEGEIGVFTEGGLLVGAGVMEKGRCGIPVRGDDPTTPLQDGAQEGEPLYLEFRYPWGGEYPLSLSPLIYRSDDIAIVEVDIASLPETSLLLTAYPNPFNSTTTVLFHIPHPGLARVEIYDLSGRLVERVWESREAQGNYRLNWQAGHRPAGYYFARLEHSTGAAVLKLLLVK